MMFVAGKPLDSSAKACRSEQGPLSPVVIAGPVIGTRGPRGRAGFSETNIRSDSAHRNLKRARTESGGKSPRDPKGSNQQNMLKIPVGDLLGDYEGARKTLLLDDVLPPDEFEDVVFIGPVSVELELIHVAFGVQAVFRRIAGTARLAERDYDEEFDVRGVEREYKRKKEDADPDDVGLIDVHGTTIDVAPALREEVLLELLNR